MKLILLLINLGYINNNKTFCYQPVKQLSAYKINNYGRQLGPQKKQWDLLENSEKIHQMNDSKIWNKM